MSTNIRLSHSAVVEYTTCPKKFYLNRIEKIRPIRLESPLIFGSAFDNALNTMLLDKKANKLRSVDWYKILFVKHWVFASNLGKPVDLRKSKEVNYSKGDYSVEDDWLFTDKDRARIQAGYNPAWLCLLRKAMIMIESYYCVALPQIKRVVDVQKTIEMQSDHGDNFVGVIDFIAELQDGRVYICDNKTTTRSYEADSAYNSDQLNIYSVILEIPNVAFFTVSKKILKRTKTVHVKVITGLPTEVAKDKTITIIDNVLNAAHNNEFYENYDSCMMYNKPCPYYNLCHNGSMVGLVNTKGGA